MAQLYVAKKYYEIKIKDLFPGSFFLLFVPIPIEFLLLINLRGKTESLEQNQWNIEIIDIYIVIFNQSRVYSLRKYDFQS